MCKVFYDVIEKLSWRSSKSHYFNPKVVNLFFKKSISNKLVVLNLMSYSSIDFEIENEQNLFNLMAHFTNADGKFSSKLLGCFKSEADAKEAFQELRVTLYMPSKLMAKYAVASVLLFGMVTSLYCMMNHGSYHHKLMEETQKISQIQNVEPKNEGSQLVQQNNQGSQPVEQNNQGSQLVEQNNAPPQFQAMHPGMTQKEQEEYLSKTNPELAEKLSASRQSASNAMKELEKLNEMRAQLDRQDEQRKILQEQLVKQIQAGGRPKQIEAPTPESYLNEANKPPQGADSILNKIK